MKSPSLIVALALSGFAIVFSDPAVAQGFTGNVEIRTYSLDTQALFELTGDDVQAIMTVPIDAIAAAAGVEAEAYTVKVRGTVVHTTMEMGEMTVDYAANRFTMYNPRNDTHTTWTGEELKQLVTEGMKALNLPLPKVADRKSVV